MFRFGCLGYSRPIWLHKSQQQDEKVRQYDNTTNESLHPAAVLTFHSPPFSVVSGSVRIIEASSYILRGAHSSALPLSVVLYRPPFLCLPLLSPPSSVMSNHQSSPSFQYEDAPEEPPAVFDPLVGSPSDTPRHLHIDHDDALELQPSPPQTPSNAHHETLPIPDTPSLVDGSLSIDVQDAPVAENEDMHSVPTSPAGAPLPIASPANSIPVAVPHILPSIPPPTTPALPQPVAVAVPPPPVDPAVAERAARRSAFFKAQAARSQLLAAEIESMQKQNEREESFWSSQEHRYSALLQRAEMADRTTKELVRWFQQSSRAVGRTLEELNQPIQLGSMETGSLKEACAATEQIRHTLVEGLSDLKEKHLTHCLSHATNLAKAMTERGVTANQVVTAASREVKKERSVNLFTLYRVLNWLVLMSLLDMLVNIFIVYGDCMIRL